MVDHREDLKLVRRVLAGDEQEFARVFRENYVRLYRFAYVRLDGDADSADEIAQSTLCRAMRKLHLFRGEASLFTWLCRICRNEIHDYVESCNRKGRRFVSTDDDPEVRAALESLSDDRHGDPATDTRRAELLRLVHMVLDYLPVSYADVLRWKYIEDLAVDEIAGRLSVTTHAAESMLARARRSFRDGWTSVTGEALPPFQTVESAP